jgi:hypothetical protein
MQIGIHSSLFSNTRRRRPVLPDLLHRPSQWGYQLGCCNAVRSHDYAVRKICNPSCPEESMLRGCSEVMTEKFRMFPFGHVTCPALVGMGMLGDLASTQHGLGKEVELVICHYLQRTLTHVLRGHGGDIGPSASIGAYWFPPVGTNRTRLCKKCKTTSQERLIWSRT